MYVYAIDPSFANQECVVNAKGLRFDFQDGLSAWGSVNVMYYKKQKIFSEKQKGFRDGLSYSTPQKSEETRGNAITQPRSHPIKKM